MHKINARPLILLGAGGHAKVVVEALRQSGRTILGLADPGKPSGVPVFGVTVLGEDHIISSYPPETIELVNGLGAMPGRYLRQEISHRMRQRGYRFATVRHPSAVVADDVELAEGVQVMAGAVIQPGVEIGTDTIINTGVCVDHDCRIAANCHLAPGVMLSGGVIIDENVHLGTGTSVVQNITIGSGAIIAAGSVLYKDISQGVKYIQLRMEQTERVGK